MCFLWYTFIRVILVYWATPLINCCAEPCSCCVIHAFYLSFYASLLEVKYFGEKIQSYRNLLLATEIPYSIIIECTYATEQGSKVSWLAAPHDIRNPV